MNPHYRYNPADVYLSFYCQEQIEQLFNKLKQERPCDYHKFGVQAYNVRYGNEGHVVTVLYDERDDKEATNIDFEKIKKEPASITSFLMERATSKASKYHLSSNRRSYTALVEGACAIDPEIGADISGYLQGAFSEETELRQHAASIEKLGSIVRDWASTNGQTLVYDGKDQKEARWKLRAFIGSYLTAFSMEDTLMLSHTGSGITYAMRVDEKGLRWHSCEFDYGIKKEKALGALVDEDFDELYDKNAYEHYILKHIFSLDNCIAMMVDGEFLPLSEQVEWLDLYLRSILEDLVCIPEIEALSEDFDERVHMYVALTAQNNHSYDNNPLPRLD